MNVPANRFIRVFLPKIAKIAAKASMNQFGFGFAGDVFFEATDCFFKGATPAVVRKELEEILQQPGKFAAEVDIAIADESPEVQAAAKLYFDQVPSAIRHGVLTYGGRDDLARRTLSKDIPLLVADDLMAFIPQSMPKFKVGDKPVSGTDLELTAFIGKGGFGEVWRARHSNRPNASEVVLKFCIDAAPSMKSLQKEVELLDNLAKKGITHPQIVRLLYSHLETTNPNPCLEYEFVDGGDLEKYLECRGESWTPLELLRIMIRIVEPVAFAHKHEIVHRDLKPRNILISISQGTETFKITDFGIGGIVRRDHWRHSHASGIDEHTTLSRGTYTPLYASTQQQDGKHPTKQDDVFAIGVMWYQLLLNDLLRRAPSGKAWKVRLSANQVTTKMIDLLEHCMECEVEDRIECAEVLLDRLKEIERTSEVNPPPKKSLDWAEILEHSPDPVVVTNLDLLGKIIESGYPWRVRHKLTGMEMLLVPEGAFEMGMSAGDAIAQDDEKPLHPVTLSKAYYIGTTLVTQEQWGRVLPKHPCNFKGDSLPVDSVSYSELLPFLGVTGLRLPTEAEWEYACRAGTSEPRYGELGDIAWHKANCDQRTHECGAKLANALGIHDMLGNLWEWCSDWYDKGYYDLCEDGVDDPTGPSTGTQRVLRGGSWRSVHTGCRASDRKQQSPIVGGDFVGFRAARSP